MCREKTRRNIRNDGGDRKLCRQNENRRFTQLLKYQARAIGCVDWYFEEQLNSQIEEGPNREDEEVV